MKRELPKGRYEVTIRRTEYRSVRWWIEVRQKPQGDALPSLMSMTDAALTRRGALRKAIRMALAWERKDRNDAAAETMPL